MRKLVPLLVALGAASACAVAPSEPGEKVERGGGAIIGGTNDTGDPAVVMIIAQGSGSTGASICSGSVVSPHVVLTAAHCVSPQVVGSSVTFMVFTGTDINDSAQAGNAALFKTVKETHYDTAFDVNRLNNGHDVAVVITSSGLDPKPLPINRTALTTAQRNKSVRMIGYGITSGSDTTGKSAGTKRQTTTTLSNYDSKFVYFYDGAHMTCEGDSGGPALLSIGGVETIVGVVSFGDKGCLNGGTDTNVASYLSFIDTYVQPDLTTWSNLAQGKTCDANSECTSGSCADGVCCNTACTGSCESCGEAGHEGTCTVLAKGQKPRAAHPSCGGTGTCGGVCDGTSATKCVMPGAETTCGKGCADGSVQACNGAGACAKNLCAGNFACASASACKTSCASNADCAAGYACTGGACVGAVTGACSDDGTSVVGADGSTVSCAPYLCDAAVGACRTACASDADCNGVACNVAAGTCGGSASAGKTSSGGCAVPAGEGHLASPAAAIALCVAALGMIKRRRR
jgi:V8-like Glu-specific endopeptidase